ncbi:hypothetical protein EXIGLDRAFT_721749 [Exidia glandulosa HHB12029]|uniref:Uncharacterized protein n=1 Tax=Exidia glandulosa HHB12029 TaxID=1314781 RepID=A0A165QFE9_EXIGL|nr:hypothetical protein EXIGLDRAFT_721749 [Exidia glandulosa HHB12029]
MASVASSSAQPYHTYADQYGRQVHHVRPRADGQPTIFYANGATIEVRAAGSGIRHQYAPQYGYSGGGAAAYPAPYNAHDYAHHAPGTSRTRHAAPATVQDEPDAAFYDQECAKWRNVNPEFAPYWRRPWGHADHRCHPPYHGWWCIIKGTLLHNEGMKARGREEREFAEREREEERRRRWELFRAEVTARRRMRNRNWPITT